MVEEVLEEDISEEEILEEQMLEAGRDIEERAKEDGKDKVRVFCHLEQERRKRAQAWICTRRMDERS